MDPQDFVDQLYLALLKQGWTLPEIDAMDVLYYLHLLRKDSTTVSYIDDVL